MTLKLILVGFLLVPAQVAPENPMPDALERAFAQRSRFETMYLRYRRTVKWPGLVTDVANCESRFAGDNEYLIEHGDDDGIRCRDRQTGEADFGVTGTCLPMHRIVDLAADERWSCQDGDTAVSCQHGAQWRPRYDVRVIGLDSTADQNATPGMVLQRWKGLDAVWRTEEKEGLVFVTCEQKPSAPGGPHRAHRWEIDPARDYAVLRVEKYLVHPDGRREGIAESNTDYQLVDGVWWPAKTECVCPESGLLDRIEYQHVEFNWPEHPKAILPEIMGAPIGIGVRTGRFADGRWGVYLGNGRIATQEEWLATKDSYDVAPLAAFRERQARLGKGKWPRWWDDASGEFGLEGVASRPDDWEAYVRRWIIKHTNTKRNPVADSLDEKQINAAHAILEDSKKQAQPIRRRIDDERIELGRTIRELGPRASTSHPAATQPAPASTQRAENDTKAAKLNAARKRLAELEGPNPEIEQIFERLKSRLEGLLRSSQTQPTSMPARLPPPVPPSQLRRVR